MNDFDQFERRIAAALRSDADLGVAPFEPASIARVAIASTQRRAARIPRASSRPARGFGRGRGLTLLAAALLLVGGAVAAGSGLVRLPSLGPSEPAPSLALVPTPSPAEAASPMVSPSPAPSETSAIVAPKPAIFVFSKGVGSSAECGNDGRGGCIPRMWVANLDGTGAHELLPDQSGCQRVQAWSPDGRRLFFSRSECRWNEELGMTGAERFYLTDARGSEPQLVDTGCASPCLSEDDAVFSSNGRQILFVRTKSVPVSPSATPDPVTGKPAEATYVRVLAEMDLATGSVTELGDFDGYACNTCGEWPRTYPRWSPDRTQIVHTWAPTPLPGPQPPSAPAVIVADADGRNARQVSAFGEVPGWSPDGTRIVFQGIRYSWSGTWFPGKVVRSSSAIYTVRADGTDLRQLTTDDISYGPAWSADGRIWFIRPTVVDGIVQDGGTVESWVMDADGSHPEQVTGQPPFQAWQIQPTP